MKKEGMYKAKVALPPAEGAEEFLKQNHISGADFVYTTGFKNMVALVEKFAALHAQRLAEKMVEEKMEQYKAQFKDRPNPQEVNPYDSKGIKRIRNRKTH